MTNLVAVGNKGVIGSSPDGAVWTKRVSPWVLMPGESGQYMHWRAVIYAPVSEVFVACGYGTDATYSPSDPPYGRNLPKIITSPDGIEWTDVGDVDFHPGTIPWDGVDQAVARGGFMSLVEMPSGRIIAAGRQSVSAYSDDGGNTWTEGNRVFDEPGDYPDNYWPVQRMHYSAQLGKIIAIAWERGHGDAAVIATSPDGLTWTNATSIDQTNAPSGDGWWYAFRDVASSPTTNVIACAHNGGVLTSTDGMTWTSRDTPMGHGAPNYEVFSSVTWSTELGLFLGIGDINTYSSPDGITWTLVEATLDTSTLEHYYAGWSGTQFVVVGWDEQPDFNYQPFAAISPDGSNFVKGDVSDFPPSPEEEYIAEQDTGFNDVAVPAMVALSSSVTSGMDGELRDTGARFS